MDDFLPQLNTTDTRTKLQLGTDIVSFLQDESNSLECSDIGHFIDGLVPWLGSSQFKVAQHGLEAFSLLAEKMGTDFKPYMTIVLPPVIDRLGDSKDLVREKAQVVLNKIMENVCSPQQLFDRLAPAFSHKNGKIREELMDCLQRTLREHGSNALSLSKLVPTVAKLLSDPVATVRDMAFSTLVEIYRHVGERLRVDLVKKQLIPATKLPALLNQFDELKNNGELLPSALVEGGSRYDDEPDRVGIGTKSRSGSLPRRAFATPGKPAATGPSSVSGLPPPSATVRRNTSLRRAASSAGGQAGALDEDAFIRQFDEVPTVQLFSARDLDEQLAQLRAIIEDVNKDWSKRVDALKRIRSVMLAGATDFDDLKEHLRLLEPAFIASVKDLRSQVVREACITIAFLSQTLHNKLDHFAESVLPNLINLIPNSTKVMASSGFVAVRFIISHTHVPRLIPILTNALTSSKAKEIRRACCEFLEQMMSSWPTHTLERHINILQEAIKKGIADADPDARLLSRRAYWGFQSHFPDQADSLLNSLDGAYKRQLQMEGPTMSASSSSSSLHQDRGRGAIPRSRASSVTGSAENLYRNTSHSGMVLPRRSGIPVLAKCDSDRQNPMASPRHRPITSGTSTPVQLRSNSAIDLQAAQRARARAQYAAAARLKVGSGASLRDEFAARQRKSSDSGVNANNITSPERLGRTRTRVAGVSQSQPTSRSGSPSSRLSYATYRENNTILDSAPMSMGSIGRPRRMGGGIPRSQGASREGSRDPSPNRYSGLAFGSKLRSRTGLTFGTPQSSGMSYGSPQSGQRTVMAQKILQQSREAESALADALSFEEDFQRTPTRKTSRLFDDHSDESETSSICSERSYDSYRRPSDYWTNSQQRHLQNNLWEQPKGIGDFILSCASTHWQDRKEGLVGLQRYLQSGHKLTLQELRQVTNIFTKIFMDSHTKVFSLFLDAVNDLITSHNNDLHDWLYILMTRLFNKLGTDLLNSTHKKIHIVMENIRTNFPAELQFGAIIRFLVDATQTPNVKVKLAALCYLAQLANAMDPTAIAGGGRDTKPALTKIIMWTNDPKSAEIRRAAGAALNALFNLNVPAVTIMLSEMPSDYQDIAQKVVAQHSRYGGADSSLPSSPRVGSPGTPTQRSLNKHLDDDDENLNAEDIHRSLQRTTAEIQNYSFDGISQMSAGGHGDKLEEKFEEMTIATKKLQSNGCMQSPASRNSPTLQRLTSTPLREFNGLDKTPSRDGSFDATDNGLVNRENHHPENPEAFQKLMEILGVEKEIVGSGGERVTSLQQLARVVKEGNAATIVENFKLLLRVLLEQLSSSDSNIRVQVLQVLTEMFRKSSLSTSFTNYVELLVLRILQCHKDPVKDVVRAAEQCAAAMVTVLSCDLVIRVLSPLITTAEFPLNQAAIKMLNRLVEQQSGAEVEAHLGDLMPLLLKAYDNDESSVRKSAVFCLVALHNCIGEDPLQPHLVSLTGSKLKLLNLYIKRAKQEAMNNQPPSSTTPSTSSPASPKNMPAL
ncbi:CLIP-associating protein 1-A isoform X3 [Neocloeon triangulifer]|uniref:CLIP-associating protein 1-A isoform X3 n=1 Tax=Neocloeon triangulifer TaxID=2078957 RepID=UPI00286ED9E2|nr:CLIP-associating protein 1-A isoform X3 [Neocloeon triangulifer]